MQIQTRLDYFLKEVEQSFQAPSPGGDSAGKENIYAQQNRRPNTELNETKVLVKEMYKGAGTNMSDILHLGDDFELPEEWVKPISKKISQYIIDDIVNVSR